jgi:hypothetical protein
VSFRASKDGFEGDSKRIHFNQTSTLDFNLTPNSRKPPRETLVLGQTQTGTFGVDPYVTCAGNFFTRPCKRFALVISSAATLRARLEWVGGHDLDLEPWRDDSLVASSLICQACGQGTSEETFTASLPAGEYEVRAVLFEGVGPTTFKLIVSLSSP